MEKRFEITNLSNDVSKRKQGPSALQLPGRYAGIPLKPGKSIIIDQEVLTRDFLRYLKKTSWLSIKEVGEPASAEVTKKEIPPVVEKEEPISVDEASLAPAEEASLREKKKKNKEEV